MCFNLTFSCTNAIITSILKGSDGMAKMKRLMAFVLIFTYAFVMLFSVSYIVSRSDHDCTDEDCAVCDIIGVCKNALSSFTSSFASPHFKMAALSVVLLVLCEISLKAQEKDTLVSLKVKLSD